MLILKKINNNVALAASDDGREVVVFGKGIGFHEMPYELADESLIQRKFYGSVRPHLTRSAVRRTGK